MFKNLHELIAKMPDETTCRAYLAAQRWNDGIVVCPYCSYRGAYVIENGKRYKCKSAACYKKFSVTVGTIFEASNIPLNKWFMALYIISGHKKGISSYQLAKDIGTSQKSAWFMLHRMREALKENSPELLSGIVESDETYMARKFASDFVGLSPEEVDYKLNNPIKNKGAVLGLAQRGGNIRVFAFDESKGDNIKPTIKANVKPGTRLMTDEAFVYRRGLDEYKHEAVFHSKREWVRLDVHTNTVENFWSVMRRGIYGIYHQISFKHLQAYCNEYSYRYNTRKLKDAERFILTLGKIEGRLTYKNLVNNGKANKQNNAAQTA